MARLNKTPIIRRVEIVEDSGHHGGAWKVAFADFMTAMMAFFLLMWIIASSDEEKLSGIAEYFTNATQPGGSGVLDGATLGPPGTLNASNGAIVARGSELGKVDEASLVKWEVEDKTPTTEPIDAAQSENAGQHRNPAGGEIEEAELNPEKVLGEESTIKPFKTSKNAAESDLQLAASITQNEEAFEKLENEIRQALEASEDLRPLKKNVVFEKTPSGLRIQIVDQKGKSMFPNGSSVLSQEARVLILQVGEILKNLPNELTITGHTDGLKYSDSSSYDNWDLSSDRANETRRTIVEAGVEAKRIVRISGLADTEPLIEENTLHPSNRRITLFVANTNGSTDNENLDQTRNKPKHSKPVFAQDEVKEEASVATQNNTVMLETRVFDDLRSELQ